MDFHTEQGHGPKYRQIAIALQQQIRDGILPPGEKLKSENEYAAAFSVSAITIKKALAELVQSGSIQRIKGKGTFVRHAQGYPGKSGSKRIALIFSSDDHGDSSHMNILKGAQQVISAKNYVLLLEWGNEERNRELQLIRKMLDQHVDGILIYPYDPLASAGNLSVIEAAGIPYVLIDRCNPDIPANYVGSDHYTGAVLAANHLISLGHKKICFLASHIFLSSEQERYSGFCSALQRAGIPFSPGQLMETVDMDLLVQKIHTQKITALFCCNDRVATAVLSGLAGQDIRIPEDVSVVGFDDWRGPAQPIVPLTTVRQHFGEIGGQSAKMLLDIINGRGGSGCKKLLTSVELIVRGSTGPLGQL